MRANQPERANADQQERLRSEAHAILDRLIDAAMAQQAFGAVGISLRLEGGIPKELTQTSVVTTR